MEKHREMITTIETHKNKEKDIINSVRCIRKLCDAGYSSYIIIDNIITICDDILEGSNHGK